MEAKRLFDTEHLEKTYFKMAIPVVFNLVVTLIYNLADTYFVAATGDTNLVAAVSLCAPIFTTLMAFGNIYGQGGSSLISRMLGKGDRDGTRRVSSFSFYAAIATGALIGVILLIFRTAFLTLFGANADTMPHAIRYYMVMAVGSPIVVLSFIHSNLLRCEGLAKESMIGSMLGTVLNIILDPILISVCGWGAMGAAVATVLGFLVSDVFLLIILLKKSSALSIHPKDCRVSGGECGQIFGVGITAAASNLMQSAAVILLNQSLLPYGNDYIAAMGVVQKVTMISLLILTGFSFGGVPLFGYLYGAGDKAHLKKLISFCLKFLLTIALVCTIGLSLGAKPVIGIFLKDAALIGIAAPMLIWQVAGTVFAAVVLLFTVLFQAMGAVAPAFIMSLSRQGVVFMVMLLLLGKLLGYNGVLAAQAAADLVSAGIGLGLYLRQMKK